MALHVASNHNISQNIVTTMLIICMHVHVYFTHAMHAGMHVVATDPCTLVTGAWQRSCAACTDRSGLANSVGWNPKYYSKECQGLRLPGKEK